MISHLPITGLPVTLQPSLQNPQMPPQRFTEHLKPKVSPPAAYGAVVSRRGKVGWNDLLRIFWLDACRASGIFGQKECHHLINK